MSTRSTTANDTAEVALYRGVAPKARIISLKVLDRERRRLHQLRAAARSSSRSRTATN